MDEKRTTTVDLEAGLAHVLDAPAVCGHLEMIVVRPAEGERACPETAVLSPEAGVEGDRWASLGADRDTQVTLINVRMLALAAGSRERWPLAGDQLIVDLDLSEANLPAGQRLGLGEAVLTVSATPHTGCKKFTDSYGTDAARFINAPARAHLHLRGINARVVQGSTVRVRDEIQKLAD